MLIICTILSIISKLPISRTHLSFLLNNYKMLFRRYFRTIAIVSTLITSTVVILSLTTRALWIFRNKNSKLSDTIVKTICNYSSEYIFIQDLLIAPSNTICRAKPLVIMLVTSHVAHVERRRVLRKAKPRRLLEAINATRIFLLANIPDHEELITQGLIDEENRNFGDILQGSFTEDYHNLTKKHLMGLQWVSKECSDASYLLKVDDDSIFSLDRLLRLLKRNKIEGDFLMGYVHNNTKPIRYKWNKWYVSWAEYPRNVYPTYLSGSYYITTPKVAGMLTNEAMNHPYFWIDDILITGLLPEALNIKVMQLPEEFQYESKLNYVHHFCRMGLLGIQ